MKSKNDGKSVYIKEGYQPTEPIEKGYQPSIGNGYKPAGSQSAAGTPSNPPSKGSAESTKGD
ncbi:hypothetical protein [Roseobacter sp. GAI101]|uniref:hypothetical protein n=1 Tax=Roseobacter sp. (strain GAI101) TaxID=391589 RepID=UPI0012EE20AB|nr:hypothetical protein [Roseobacter sp. GAI101]